jgi:spermidine/putrescine transport system permease protein
MVTRSLKKLYIFLIFLFLYAPIIMLILYSFNAGKSSGNWEGFSLKWYGLLFKDRYIMEALMNTILVAVLSSTIATVIGTFAAYGIHTMKSMSRKIILNINNIPILNPDIVTGVSLMALFAFIKLPFGFLTLLLAHITFNIPYVILSVLPKLKQMPNDTIEAALDLGATPTMAFWQVVLPEIKPGIISGFLIAFTMSIDDFVISFFTTGGGVSNLSIAIFSMARRGVNPKINALSTLLFVTVVSLLLLINTKKENKVIGGGLL